MAANLDIVIKATNNTGPTFTTVGKGLGELEGSAKSVNTAFGGISDAAGKAFDFVVKSAAVAGVAVAGTIATMSVKGLTSFGALEKGMNEVFTLLPGITETAMGEMTKSVQEFDKKFGVLSQDSVPALYQALSAGVPRENVFAFMEAAQKAALGGVSTLTVAVDGLTSVTNAYGLDVLSVDKASDLMFTAVRIGKTTFDDLSSSLFNVAPMAAALDVPFNDIAAAMAAITLQGVPTNVAATSLRQLLSELGKEGSTADKAFRDLAGVGFREFINNGGTMQEALSLMERGAKDSGKGINDLFGSVEAGMSALALTGKGTKPFLDALGEMNNSSGATQAAFETMDGGIQRSIDKIKAAFQVMMERVGEKLAPTFQVAADWFLENMPKLEDLVVGVFSEMATWAKEQLPTALGKLQEAFGYVRDVLIPLAKESIPEVIGKAKELWDMIAPMIAKIGEWVIAFGNMETGQRNLILAFGAVILAIGPISSAVAGLATVIGGITSVAAGVGTALIGAGGLTAALALLAGPVGIGLAVAAVAGLALAWKTDFGGIRTETSTKAAMIAETVNNLGRSVATSLSNSMYIAQSGWNAAWGNLVGTISSKAADMRDRAASAGRDVSSSLTGGVQNGASAFRSTLSTMADYVRGVFTEKKNDWLTAGRDVAYGIRDGVSNQASGLYNQLRSMGTSMLSSFKNALGIRSPSTEFMEAGYNIALGLAVGIDSGGNLVDAALSDIQAKTEYALRKQAEYMDAWMRDTINANAAAVQQTKSLQQQVFALSQAQYAVYSQAMAAGNSQAAALAAAQQAATGGGGASTGGSGPNSGTGAASAPAQFYTPETLPAQYQSLQQEIYEKIYGFLSGIGMSRFDVQGQITTESVQGAVAHIKEKVLDALRGVTDVLTGGLSVNDIVSKVPQLQEAIKWLTSVDVHGQTGSSLQAAVSLDLRQKLMGFSDEIGKIFQDASTQLNAITKASQIGSLLSNPGGAINSLKTLVSNTFGNVSISDITDQFSDVSNRIYGRVSGAVGYGQDLAGLTTDKVRDAVKNLLSAGTDSNVGDIKEAIDTLLQFRNLTSEQRKIDSHGVFDDFGTTTQTGNTFNVTFNGVSGNQQGILADIQFLNSLYGATP